MASAHETTVRQVYEAANQRDMDGLIVRIEGFTEREAGRALEAT